MFVIVLFQLVERGADVNAMDAKGVCVLHYAMQSSEYDMAIWLQSVGAKRCSGRCNRCALFLKMVDRRRVIKLAEAAAARAPAVVSRRKQCPGHVLHRGLKFTAWGIIAT